MTCRTTRVEPVRCYQLEGADCMAFRCDAGIFTEVWYTFEGEYHHIATHHDLVVPPSAVRLAVYAFRAGVEHGRNWAKDQQRAQDYARHKAGM